MNVQANDGVTPLIQVSVTLKQRVFDTDVEVSAQQLVPMNEQAFYQTSMAITLATSLTQIVETIAPVLPQSPDKPKQAEQWQDVTSYTVDEFSGNKVVKIKTKEFYKHGVRIFETVLANAGYAIAGFPVGEHKPLNWQVLIGVDGKGHPIISRLKTPSSTKE